MKKILILAGRYLPGYKDGGPVRTLINLTDLLGDEYEFRLAVLDRDHGDTQSYPNIKIGEWNEVGKAKVWYYRQGEMNKALILALAKDADLIYSCGFYDGYGYKTLSLNNKNKLGGKPVVVASMGSFTKGALSQKSLKKKVFIRLCKLLGYFKNITWSVTSSYEEKDVKRIIGEKARCVIAEDLPRKIEPLPRGTYSPEGKLRLLFLSRIAAHKNLSYAIEVLKKVKAEVAFDIYGPIQEEGYWAHCQEGLKGLPDNVTWSYLGEVATEKVPEVFSNYDAFILPTKGENYGHVIFESLAAGCIPIVSDQTPWDSLERRGAGFTLPLANEESFVRALTTVSAMSAQEKQAWGESGKGLAQEKVKQAKESTGYREIFQ